MYVFTTVYLQNVALFIINHMIIEDEKSRYVNFLAQSPT